MRDVTNYFNINDFENNLENLTEIDFEFKDKGTEVPGMYVEIPHEEFECTGGELIISGMDSQKKRKS